MYGDGLRSICDLAMKDSPVKKYSVHFQFCVPEMLGQFECTWFYWKMLHICINLVSVQKELVIG